MFCILSRLSFKNKQNNENLKMQIMINFALENITEKVMLSEQMRRQLLK